MSTETQKHYRLLGGSFGFLITFLWGVFIQRHSLINMVWSILGYIIGVLASQLLIVGGFHFFKEGMEDYTHKKV